MASTARGPGTTIAGRYVLDAQLGAGAFGQVWLAHDARAFNRKVAVKFLLEQHVNNPDVVGRFWREGQAMAALTHPNVVTLLEFGQEDGVPYLVNEFVEGESLRASIDRHARARQMFTRAEAIAVFRQICAGVGAAHEKGIVHRDLKPENVMIQGTGTSVFAKVLDFGVARILDAGPSDRTKTETGRIIGSLQYMSPEQVLGDTANIDARTDLFALGALLFEILTLRQAFDGSNFHDIVATILQGTRQQVTPTRPDLAPAVDAVVARALAGRAPDRYQRASELLEAAEAALSAPSAAFEHAPTAVPAPPSQPSGPRADVQSVAGVTVASERRAPSGRGRWAGILVTVALLAAGAFGVRAMRHSRATTPATVIQPPRPTVHDDTPLDDPSFWVTIPAPRAPVRLGFDEPGQRNGFAPSAGIVYDGPAFQIHRHEVTWDAWEVWARGHADREVRPPSWLPPDASQRAGLPIVGISWQLAADYCHALGGDLPTEMQWEYAARGSERRPNPWGEGPPRGTLAAFMGEAPTLHTVSTTPADRTPLGVDDLAANAEEWTASRYRLDDGSEPGWSITVRTIRGWPLREARPPHWPPSAIYRNSACATDSCAVEDRTAQESIGFRCVRPVR